MAFNELDLKRIDRIVGGLCRRRTRPEFADQLRLDYEVDRQNVVVFEERPDWRDATQRMRTPVAKLRFVRTTGAWTLYCSDSNSRWHVYELAEPTADLGELIDAIDMDRTGIFWG